MSASEPPATASEPRDSSESHASQTEYASLRERVDSFFAAVMARHPTAMHCQAGCSGCCQEGLSVSSIEAAAIREFLATRPPAERQQLKQRAQRHNQGRRSLLAAQSCVMLDADGRCSIYPVRPLVCRSQGLPLSYAAELVPVEAVRFAARDGRAVVLCPLNFAPAEPAIDQASDSASAMLPVEPPAAQDILDGDRLDVLLALLNRRYVIEAGTAASKSATEDASLLRHTLTDLAAAAEPQSLPGTR